MDRAGALRRWNALGRMTLARGCTAAEAATARRLAASLGARWGFGGLPSQPRAQDYDVRYQRAERHAAQRWHWEYRKCGKSRCHCVHDRGHGPYKYSKRRVDGVPHSIYLGR